MNIKQPSSSDLRPIALSTQQSPAPATAPPMSFKVDIWRSLRLHALAASVVALLIFGLGLAVLLRSPSYVATSVVYVSPTFPATLTPEQEQQYPYDSFVAEQAHSVSSYDVLAAALSQLKPGVWQKQGESMESAVSRLQRRLVVGRAGLTYQVDISLSGARPDHLAEIVNTVTKSYLSKTKGEEFYGRDQRLAALRQARTEVQNELNAKLQEQDKISHSLGVAVIGSGDAEGTDQLDSQVAKLRTDLTTAHEQRIQAEAELNSLESGNTTAVNSALNAAADEIIAADPSLQAMKTSLSQKRATLLEQLAGLTPNHPLRKQTEEELAQIEAGLQQMQTDLRSKAAARLEQKDRTELSRTRAIEASYMADLQSYTNKATTAAPQFQRAAELKNDITTLQARYAQLDERTRNLELESSSPGSIHLFSEARTPVFPEESKIEKLAPLLLPFALLMGVATAVFIDVMDPRIHSENDVERVLGYSPIGTIFDDREVTLHAFDECGLRLAAGIDQAARNVGVRTIVVTAVNAGAGTTSIVENLGSTLAKLGRKTLTIDASGTTAPVAYVTIGFNRAAQKAEAGANAQRPATMTHLDLQPAAVVAQPFTPSLTPLTSFMDQAFKDLTSEYDLVLIDATPLMISAETEYLARFADVTIVVAESGKTKKAELVRATKLLERLNVRGVGAIVNKVSLLRADRTVKQDLQDFEERMNKMNLRWRPVNDEPVTAPAAPGFENVEQPAAKENPSYA
jgi:polysaccharide biosynthesis transport protein